MKRFGWGLATLLMLLSTGSAAKELARLYWVEVEVPSRNEQQRQVALDQAFERILQRISGQSAVMGAAGIAEERANIQRYIQQFQYQQDDSSGQQWLQVQFNETAIVKLLRQSGIPVWGRQRPEVLLWLAHEDRGRRQILAEGQQQPLAEVLTLQAQRRGLPVLLPILDLEDESLVAPSDVWGGFVGPVQQASQRYGAQVVVSGRVAQLGTQWQGEWQLLVAGQRQTFAEQAESQEAVVAALMMQVTEALAAQFALVGEDETQLALQVENITELAHYAQLHNYLSELDAVRQVWVEQVLPSQVTLKVAVIGGVQALTQALALDTKLQLTPADAVESGVLTGRWQP